MTFNSPTDPDSLSSVLACHRETFTLQWQVFLQTLMHGLFGRSVPHARQIALMVEATAEAIAHRAGRRHRPQRVPKPCAPADCRAPDDFMWLAERSMVPVIRNAVRHQMKRQVASMSTDGLSAALAVPVVTLAATEGLVQAFQAHYPAATIRLTLEQLAQETSA
jgi:hypothetical protein